MRSKVSLMVARSRVPPRREHRQRPVRPWAWRGWSGRAGLDDAYLSTALEILPPGMSAPSQFARVGLTGQGRMGITLHLGLDVLTSLPTGDAYSRGDSTRRSEMRRSARIRHGTRWSPPAIPRDWTSADGTDHARRLSPTDWRGQDKRSSTKRSWTAIGRSAREWWRL
jgi:hypothetical protein